MSQGSPNAPPFEQFIECLVVRIRKIADDVETAIGASRYPEAVTLLLLAHAFLSQSISTLSRAQTRPG